MDHLHTEPASTRLKWFGWTDRGRVRPNNEDAFLGVQFNAEEIHHLGKVGEAATKKMDLAFAVSDGMGGARAGEYASRTTIDKITKLLPHSFRHGASGLAAGFEDLMEELFGEVHHALAYIGSCYEECQGMEATLSLCWFTPAWMYFGHIGDSRIYYLPAQGTELKQLSEDDTYVGWLFRNGQINEREARTHPRRSVLQKALGNDHQFNEPQVGAVGYQAGDMFLLCTDGLVDGLYNHRIVDLMRATSSEPAFNPAQVLVEASVAESGRDNTTALVIQVT